MFCFNCGYLLTDIAPVDLLVLHTFCLSIMVRASRDLLTVNSPYLMSKVAVHNLSRSHSMLFKVIKANCHVQPLPSGTVPPDSAVLLGCVLYIVVLGCACLMVRTDNVLTLHLAECLCLSDVRDCFAFAFAIAFAFPFAFDACLCAD